MGIDDSFVERVIQWKAKTQDNLDTLIQRFGRYARNLQLQGLCLLHYEKEFVGNRIVPATGNKGTKKRTADGQLKTNLSADAKRGLMDSGLYRYINPPALTMSHGNTGHINCPRRVILGYYGDQEYGKPGVYTDKCCDLCRAEEFNRLAPHIGLKSCQFFQKPKSTRLANAPIPLQESIRSFLIEARSRIFLREYSDSKNIVDAQILPPKKVDIIATKCKTISSNASLFAIPGLIIDPLLGKYGKTHHLTQTGHLLI